MWNWFTHENSCVRGAHVLQIHILQHFPCRCGDSVSVSSFLLNCTGIPSTIILCATLTCDGSTLSLQCKVNRSVLIDYYINVVKSKWTRAHSGSAVTWEPRFTYDQSRPGIQIPRPKRQHVYVWKAVYVGQCARGLKGWEIMSTKGAPGALDWVSLLPFLPLSLFHPPLPFSSGHFQHYPGTFKRLDHSFYNCATNACQQLGMSDTNGQYYFLLS